MSGTTPVTPIPLLPEWRGVSHPVIGMLHAPPLPGSPGFAGSFEAILARVLDDAEVLVAGGVDGLMLENFGDVPFAPARVSAVTVSSMTRIAVEISRRVDVPLGINVLRNDAESALAIAVVTGARFVRVNVLSSIRVSDQGLLPGVAYDLLRLRKALDAQDIRILADVDVKHSAALARRPLAEETEELVLRSGADAVIVSGAATGKPVSLTDLPEVVAAAVGRSVFVGSGVSPATLERLLPFCHGFIVGSSLKRDGQAANPVDPRRVRELMSLIKS